MMTRLIRLAAWLISAMWMSGCVTAPVNTVVFEGRTYGLAEGPSEATASENKTFALSRKGSTVIRNPVGDVVVTPWELDSVHVAATKRVSAATEEQATAILKNARLRMAQRGRTFEIAIVAAETATGKNAAPCLMPRTDLAIRVPWGTYCQISAGRGNITASGSLGTTTARAKTGDIEISDVRGGVAAHTDSGDIQVRGIHAVNVVATANRGSVRLENVNAKATVRITRGTLSAVNINGRLLAKVTEGDIRVENPYGTVDARTGSGDISLSVVGEDILEPIALQTAGGNVRFTGPPNVRAELRLSAEGGVIRSGYEIQAKGVLSENAARGSINGGGQTLTLATAAGNITLETREPPVEFLQ